MSASTTSDILKGTAAKPAQYPWMAWTAAQLLLARAPERPGQSGGVNIVLSNTINLRTNGSSTDVSNASQQIVQGVAKQLSENDVIKQISAGVTG